MGGQPYFGKALVNCFILKILPVKQIYSLEQVYVLEPCSLGLENSWFFLVQVWMDPRRADGGSAWLPCEISSAHPTLSALLFILNIRWLKNLPTEKHIQVIQVNTIIPNEKIWRCVVHASWRCQSDLRGGCCTVKKENWLRIRTERNPGALRRK